MHAIQENEHGQFRELVSFLDLEMNFVQSYLDVLKDVKSDVESYERYVYFCVFYMLLLC